MNADEMFAHSVRNIISASVGNKIFTEQKIITYTKTVNPETGQLGSFVLFIHSLVLSNSWWQKSV